MKKCPNCDRVAIRTEDWACQWCGYPLLSESYKKVDIRFSQLRADRLPSPYLEEENEPELEPESVAEPEEVIEIEPQVETDIEPEEDEKEEPETAVEVEPEPKPEPPAQKPKPRARRKPAAKPSKKPDAVVDKPDEPAVKPASRRKSAVSAKTKPAAPENLTPDIEITVGDLLDEYNDDGAVAEEKYNGKTVRLTGIAERIEVKDNLGIFYVTLSRDNINQMMQGVRCIFTPESALELSKLEAGQVLTVQGLVSGSLIDINLRDCIVMG